MDSKGSLAGLAERLRGDPSKVEALREHIRRAAEGGVNLDPILTPKKRRLKDIVIGGVAGVVMTIGAIFGYGGLVRDVPMDPSGYTQTMPNSGSNQTTDTTGPTLLRTLETAENWAKTEGKEWLENVRTTIDDYGRVAEFLSAITVGIAHVKARLGKGGQPIAQDVKATSCLGEILRLAARLRELGEDAAQQAERSRLNEDLAKKVKECGTLLPSDA